MNLLRLSIVNTVMLFLCTPINGLAQTATGDMAFKRISKNIIRIDGLLNTGAYEKFLAQVDGEEKEIFLNTMGEMPGKECYLEDISMKKKYRSRLMVYVFQHAHNIYYLLPKK